MNIISDQTNIFQSSVPNIVDNGNLRVPQREGYLAIHDYFQSSGLVHNEIGVVLPVGSGKTGLITLAPFAVGARRVLVIAPGLRITEQLFKNFDPNSPELFYKRFDVLKAVNGLEPAEIRGDDTNFADLADANVVITNIQQLQGSDNSWLSKFPIDFFDLIINDEAHHNIASSWLRVREAFPMAKVINFSATPDRADGQRMAGKIIYTFSVFQAIQNNYIKKLSAVVLNPRTLKYVRRSGGHEVIVDLEEVKRLGSQDADFRRSIVSSSESLATIVDAAIRELETRRQATGDSRHKIIASALNMEHCIQITSAFSARGLRCEYVHSKLDSKVNERILRRLRDHELDALVQVRMLGEGFDHPYFSVAAVLSIFANLSPFVQFVGRIMRTIDSDKWEENNQGTVVFHAGANVASVWSDFQDFSQLDRDFYDQLLPLKELWLEGQEEHVTPVHRLDYEPKLEITGQTEIGLESIPLLASDPDAQDAIQLLLSKGISADDYRRAAELLSPITVTKQRQRRASRLALDSRIRNATARLLADHGVSPEGRKLDKKHLGRTNFVVIKSAIDRECNTLVGKKSGSRAELSQKEYDQIQTEFPAILQRVSEQLFDG
jgi:superfamily II DNA or RNA helicase